MELPPSNGPAAAERFGPLLRRTDTFGRGVASEWVEELQRMQWNQMRSVFFSTFLIDPPRAQLTKAYLKELFDRADEDENGDLDRDEIAGLVERAHIEGFRKQLDLLVALAHRFAPRVGKLSDDAVERVIREQYKQALEKRKETGSLARVANRFYDSLDRNADGRVSRREFVSGYLAAFQAAQGSADDELWERDAWRPGTPADRLAYYRKSAAGPENPGAKLALAELLNGEGGVPTGEDGERVLRPAAALEGYEALRQGATLSHHGCSYRLAGLYSAGAAPPEGVRADMARDAEAYGPSSRGASMTPEQYCASEARRLYAVEAAAGDSRSAYQLARLLIADGKWAQALEWLERSADKVERRTAFARRVKDGDAAAMYELGARQMLGSAFERPNTAEAVAMFRRAAEGGNADALNTMAVLHYVGMGSLVEKDARRARDLWQMAANRGHERARQLYEERKAHDEEAKREAAEGPLPPPPSSAAAAGGSGARASCVGCDTPSCAVM